MKTLIIGNRQRSEKYMPDNAFTRSMEKIYVPLGENDETILRLASDVQFIQVDAIGEVSARLIENMPNLKLIHSEGVGYNGIDVEAAANRGVIVCNNKGINAKAVAEQTLLLMLGLLRTVTEGDRMVRAGMQIQMKERRMLEGIAELADCKVGIIGFGDIGREVASLLCAFGCEIYYYSAHKKDDATEQKYGVRYMQLKTLLNTCDFVSLHAPVTPDTREMVNDEFLGLMKPGSYLINTARGELVNNAALCRALTEGRIAGAGLDTVAPEPVTSDNPLLGLPEETAGKILFSPHLGGITTSTFKRGFINIWKAFEDVSEGRRPQNIVNGL
ncbi:MAG: NAD(P)-binding domain-containing protein [Lachnospiraceae bacterium]|nr:NAD(P)-binding domain-containing protein [Lachnospiraceae bacterium]